MKKKIEYHFFLLYESIFENFYSEIYYLLQVVTLLSEIETALFLHNEVFLVFTTQLSK